MLGGADLARLAGGHAASGDRARLGAAALGLLGALPGEWDRLGEDEAGEVLGEERLSVRPEELELVVREPEAEGLSAGMGVSWAVTVLLGCCASWQCPGAEGGLA